jgi:diguanylate cyclase (GGDEF)-like protein
MEPKRAMGTEKFIFRGFEKENEKRYEWRNDLTGYHFDRLKGISFPPLLLSRPGPTMKASMKKILLYTLIGLLLGLWAPLGALLLLWFSPHAGLDLPDFVAGALRKHLIFFIFTLSEASLFFSISGFFLGRRTDAMANRNRRLNREVLTDPLTGLGNHRFLHERFKLEFGRHRVSRQPISCLMMDLDHFKRINDSCGHPYGDYVLERFAAVLKKCIRAGDLAARYGGEEFLVILPNCDREEVRKVAERIRRDTERQVFTHRRKRFPLTVSLGAVTSYESSGFHYRQLIALSDRALYDAKGNGRNRLIQTTLRMAKKHLKKQDFG